MNLRLEGALGGDAHSVQGSRRFGGRGGKSCVGDAKEDARVGSGHVVPLGLLGHKDGLASGNIGGWLAGRPGEERE